MNHKGAPPVVVKAAISSCNTFSHESWYVVADMNVLHLFLFVQIFLSLSNVSLVYRCKQLFRAVKLYIMKVGMLLPYECTALVLVCSNFLSQNNVSLVYRCMLMLTVVQK